MRATDEDMVIIKNMIMNQLDRIRLKEALQTIISEEIEKDENEMDTQLVKDCSDTLMEIDNCEGINIDVGQKIAEIKKLAKSKKQSYWMRTCRKLKSIAVAACIVLVLTITANYVIVKAFNINIADKVVEYGTNFIKFNFSQKDDNYSTNADISAVIGGLVEEFKQHNILPLLPAYLPSYLKQSEFKSDSLPNGVNTFSVSFKGKGKSLTMLLIHYQDETKIPEIKNPESNLISKIKVGEADVYFTGQGNIYNAVFNKDMIIYNISSNLDYNEFVKIILSFVEHENITQ